MCSVICCCCSNLLCMIYYRVIFIATSGCCKILSLSRNFLFEDRRVKLKSTKNGYDHDYEYEEVLLQPILAVREDFV